MLTVYTVFTGANEFHYLHSGYIEVEPDYIPTKPPSGILGTIPLDRISVSTMI